MSLQIWFTQSATAFESNRLFCMRFAVRGPFARRPPEHTQNMCFLLWPGEWFASAESVSVFWTWYVLEGIVPLVHAPHQHSQHKVCERDRRRERERERDNDIAKEELPPEAISMQITIDSTAAEVCGTSIVHTEHIHTYIQHIHITIWFTRIYTQHTTRFRTVGEPEYFLFTRQTFRALEWLRMSRYVMCRFFQASILRIDTVLKQKCSKICREDKKQRRRYSRYEYCTRNFFFSYEFSKKKIQCMSNNSLIPYLKNCYRQANLMRTQLYLYILLAKLPYGWSRHKFERDEWE